jgi:hypothetical protein
MLIESRASRALWCTAERGLRDGGGFPEDWFGRRRLREYISAEETIAMFEPGQSVRVNLAGIQVGDVLFHQAVTAAVGKIVRRTSDDPPKYLVRLLFSFRGVSEVEVAEDRILAS